VRATDAGGDLHEPRPAQARPPQGRAATVDHHFRRVGQIVGVDCLEVALGIQIQSAQHVARLHGEARIPPGPYDRLALEIGDRAEPAVGPHHEHARHGVSRGDDLEVTPRPAETGQDLVSHFARHQPEVESAGSTRATGSPIADSKTSEPNPSAAESNTANVKAAETTEKAQAVTPGQK